MTHASLISASLMWISNFMAPLPSLALLFDVGVLLPWLSPDSEDVFFATAILNFLVRKEETDRPQLLQKSRMKSTSDTIFFIKICNPRVIKVISEFGGYTRGETLIFIIILWNNDNFICPFKNNSQKTDE